MIRKNNRKLIAAAAVVLVILMLGYMLFVYDSGANFYKKFRVRSYAKSYVTKNYPDFSLEEITVSYDRALNYYIADCKSGKDVITLNYNPSLFMEFDCYYNEKYTAAATAYQEKMEKRLSKALKDRSLECDSVSVYVDLDSADKKNIVYNDAKIKNERIECIITYVSKENEKVMDKYEFAALVRSVASCIYGEIDDDAQISALKVKYDYDDTKVASILWSRRMEKMSDAELAEEIKY